MKKYLAIFMTLMLFVGIIPTKAVMAENLTGTTYYVDYTQGNDNNDGTSINKPWKTLERVNEEIFEPGDKILFKSGEVWTGVLNPKGSGVNGSPIIIDMYGGDIKPKFIGEETAPHVFYLYNEEYWEINNLDISANYTSQQERRAVYIKAEDMGVVDHIYLKNLDIHDVEINLKYPNSNAYKTSGGIFVQITGNSVPTKYDDLVIENCTIQDVDRTGIQLLWSSWSNRGGANTGSGRWYPSTNVVVRNNLIKSTAGDGIVVQGTDGAIIEHNIIDDFAARNQGVAYNCAAWSHNSDNTIFRYNTGLNGNTTKDGMPWDSDGYSNGTVFEYNYSKNNEGGTYLIISYGEGASPTGLADSRDSIFRYNISENDRFALMTMTNPVGNHKIYNNVFYVGPERKVDAFFYGNMSHKDVGVNLANNIFYVDEKDGKSGSLNGNWSTKFEYDSNIYYSKKDKGISKLPKDPNKITEDPMFVAPGAGENGYKVMENSPAINAGKYIVDNGGRDYYGNKLYNGRPDIGVHEYSDKIFELPSDEGQSVFNGSEIIEEEALEADSAISEFGIAHYEEITEEVPVENLIVNGDFESSQSIGSAALKDTWYKGGNSIGEIAETYKSSGNYGLMVKNRDNGGSFINYQPVLKENTTYKLTYDAKKVSGNPKGIQVKWFDPNSDSNNGYDGGITNNLTTEWRTYEFEFTTGESFKDGEPAMIFIASTPNGEIWMDNIQLVEVKNTVPDEGNTQDLMVNGDFEINEAIGSAAIKGAWYKNAAGIANIGSDYKKDGQYGLMVKNHASGGSFVNYQPTLKTNTIYKLTYDAKKVSGNPMPLKIKGFNQDDSTSAGGYDGGVGAQLSNEWANYEIKFNTGNEFVNSNPPIIFVGSTPNGEIWIDNVKLIEVGPYVPETGDGEEEAFDLTKTKELLAEAEDILSAAIKGDEIGQTPEMVVNRLDKAVKIAREVVVYEKHGVNKHAQDDIEVMLQRVIDAANRCKITENTGNVDGKEGVTIADLAYAIKFMGYQVDLFNNGNWDEAKYADLDGDDGVDFEDMMKLAVIISKNNNDKDIVKAKDAKNSLNIGDTFEVVYSLEDLSNLVAQDLNIIYDTKVLDLVGINTTIGHKNEEISVGVKKNYHSVLNNKLEEGNNIILIADNYKNALNGDMPIISLKFEVIGEGNTSVVVYDDLVDVNGNIDAKESILEEVVVDGKDDESGDDSEGDSDNKPGDVEGESEDESEGKDDDVIVKPGDGSNGDKEDGSKLPITGGTFVGIPLLVAVGLIGVGIKKFKK